MVTLHRLALVGCLTIWLATTRFVGPQFSAAAGPVIVFTGLLGSISISSLLRSDREFPTALIALLSAALPLVGGIMTASLVTGEGAERLAASAYLILRLMDFMSARWAARVGEASP